MIVDLDWDKIPEDIAFDLRGFAQQYGDDNTYHLILLGDQAVGKTTYINNVVHNKFKHLPTLVEGMTLSLLTSGKDLIMLWKTQTVLNIFSHIGEKLSMMDGVLGMFDLTDRKTFDQLVDHIGYLIREYGKMYPLLLIGNKADIPERDISKEDVLVYAYELGNCSCHRVPYAEMSSLHNIGVDQVVDHLLTMINCNLMEKCSELPALTRNWCKVPQFYSFQEEPRQKLNMAT